MAPAASLVRLPFPPCAGLPAESSGGRAKTLVLPQGFGRHAGVSSLAVRAKESDDFSALASEKPAEPAPAKREAWKGFGREMSNGDDEVQMQGESASWNVLNQIGVELDSENSYTALVYGHLPLLLSGFHQLSFLHLIQFLCALNSSYFGVPQVMEVVGLGFTVWFTSRYLIFKENRDELITRIGSIKKQILGSRGD
ncbi:hypothetical protein GUJ93_ZPchr0009g273 [Zizania palustris]|uniref:Cyanobacterial aminoacyl-tRNA synthetase CAAD domain-containing protein n=1 Tax=Zizania palustris TaxID=103762 RepID=A0A8J5RR03_ZIZPA|nr:hypothetical protein GUJ93_ZPchr0009g273 [Zizania palustris]